MHLLHPTRRAVRRTALLPLFGLLGLLLALPTHAEQPGLSHGRLATPAGISPRSVEFGLRYADEFSYLGLRLNRRIGDRTTAIVDVGSTRFDGQSPATTVGIGAFYYWGPLSEWLDFALKGAVHHVAGRSDTTFLGFDAVFSSSDVAALASRWQWYASIGLYRPLNRSESPDVGASFGLVTPTTGGQLYAGYDVDDEAFTLGYRKRLR